VEKIVQYCEETMEIIEHCGGTKEGFMNDRICRNACTTTLTQIGESANRLSEPAKCQMNVISWNLIRGMRNILVHDYISVDWSMIWSTITNDIPILKLVCEGYLKN